MFLAHLVSNGRTVNGVETAKMICEVSDAAEMQSRDHSSPQRQRDTHWKRPKLSSAVVVLVHYSESCTHFFDQLQYTVLGCCTWLLLLRHGIQFRMKEEYRER